MVEAALEGVEFAVANTDAQALAHSRAERRIQLGGALTQGLGAGSRPEIGASAAEESLEDIREALQSCHMVFITAGMGGGTGTGAAPVIARAARDMGILTVGVVTKPFAFEGQRRMRLAEEGIQRLQASVDTLIIIPNQNLFRVANEKTTFAKAFAMADDVLYSGVRGVTDLMVMPGLINLDFADVRTVMSEMGKAMMGTGEADGEKRAIAAAEAAISNPLLDHTSMKGAKGVLINITGGMDLTLFEVDEAANKIRAEVDTDANIIVGSTFDERLAGSIRVSVVATGIEADAQHRPIAKPQNETIKASAGTQSLEQRHSLPMPRNMTGAIATTTFNPVHAWQSEIAQSGIAQTGFTQPLADESIEDRLLEARKIAARVAAQSGAQEGLRANAPPMRQDMRANASSIFGDEGGRSDQAIDLGLVGRPLMSEFDKARFDAASEPRRSSAGGQAPEKKKKSPLSFLGDIGIPGFGSTNNPTGTSKRDRMRDDTALTPRQNRQTPAIGGGLPIARDSFVQDTAEGAEDARKRRMLAARLPASPSQTNGPATPSRSSPQPTPFTGNSEEDQLEIPAFLRRQVN
jgi:cell division protein FtsZ